MTPQIRTAGFGHALAIILVFATVAVACTTATAAGDSDRWRVINPLTDPPTPIPNATIIVTYHGIESVIVESKSFCDRTEVVQSDDQGWFSVPPSVGRRTRVVTPHKEGHAYPGAQFMKTAKREVYLTPNPTLEQRIKHMNAVSAAVGCASEGKSVAAVVQFLDRVVSEMVSMPNSPDKSELLRMMREARDIHASYRSEKAR